MGLQSKKLSSFVGCLKDKASQSKATLFPTSSPTAPHLAVLRATAHQPPDEPAHPGQIEALLAFGRGSRLAAASAVGALTSRLHRTRNSTVALKCLIAVHHITKHGGFILQDQLVSALNPSFSGRNHLNLSGFRDGSSPESWLVSSVVRWYAGFLELLLFSYRVLGTFPNSRSSFQQGEVEKVTSLLNEDLFKEIESLVALVEETCRAPEICCRTKGSDLIGELVRLVEEDRMTAEFQILVRLREMGERGFMRFGDSVELVCLLRRLEGCREKIEPSDGEWRAGDEFRDVVRKLKERAGAVGVGREQEEGGGRLSVRREMESESARHGERVILSSLGSIRFGSSRWS